VFGILFLVSGGKNKRQCNWTCPRHVLQTSFSCGILIWSHLRNKQTVALEGPAWRGGWTLHCYFICIKNPHKRSTVESPFFFSFLDQRIFIAISRSFEVVTNESREGWWIESLNTCCFSVSRNLTRLLQNEVARLGESRVSEVFVGPAWPAVERSAVRFRVEMLTCTFTFHHSPLQEWLVFEL